MCCVYMGDPYGSQGLLCADAGEWGLPNQRLQLWECAAHEICIREWSTFPLLGWICTKGCWHISTLFLKFNRFVSVMARQNVLNALWEHNHVLKLLPCALLKWQKPKAKSISSRAQIDHTLCLICVLGSFCHHFEGTNLGWEGTRRAELHKSFHVLTGGCISKRCSFSYLKLHPTCLSPSCRNNRPLER